METVKRACGYLGRVLRAGLPLLGTIFNAAQILVGLSLITVGGIILSSDPALFLICLFLVLVIVYVVGAYRVWDASDRARQTLDEASTSDDELPTNLQLRRLHQDGDRLRDQLENNLAGRFMQGLVNGWTNRVQHVLSSEDALLARQFIDLDDGVYPKSTFMDPEGTAALMSDRLALVAEIIEQLDAQDGGGR